MNSREVHERITEFSKIRQNAGKDEEALLEVALFVEDVFGLVLSDQEICEENLGTHQATENFVLQKLRS
jgi:acyl carrier protein